MSSYKSYRFGQAVSYWAKKGVSIVSKDQAYRLWQTMEKTGAVVPAIYAHRAYMFWPD